jgi:hypothetical protein
MAAGCDQHVNPIPCDSRDGGAGYLHPLVRARTVRADGRFATRHMDPDCRPAAADHKRGADS